MRAGQWGGLAMATLVAGGISTLLASSPDPSAVNHGLDTAKTSPETPDGPGLVGALLLDEGAPRPAVLPGPKRMLVGSIESERAEDAGPPTLVAERNGVVLARVALSWGRFELLLPALGSGPLNLAFGAPGHQTRTMSLPADHADVGDLRLPAATRYRGRFVDARNGIPLANVEATLRHPTSGLVLATIPPSGEDGHFEVPMPGSAVYFANSDGPHRSALLTIHARRGNTCFAPLALPLAGLSRLEDVRLVHSGAPLRLRVVDESGRAQAGLFMRATPGICSFGHDDAALDSGATDERGEWSTFWDEGIRVLRIRAGIDPVEFVLLRGHWSGSQAPIKLQLPSAPQAWTVCCQRNGHPLVGARVQVGIDPAEVDDDMFTLEGVTKANGCFTFALGKTPHVDPDRCEAIAWAALPTTGRFGGACHHGTFDGRETLHESARHLVVELAMSTRAAAGLWIAPPAGVGVGDDPLRWAALHVGDSTPLGARAIAAGGLWFIPGVSAPDVYVGTPHDPNKQATWLVLDRGGGGKRRVPLTASQWQTAMQAATPLRPTWRSSSTRFVLQVKRNDLAPACCIFVAAIELDVPASVERSTLRTLSTDDVGRAPLGFLEHGKRYRVVATDLAGGAAGSVEFTADESARTIALALASPQTWYVAVRLPDGRIPREVEATLEADRPYMAPSHPGTYEAATGRILFRDIAPHARALVVKGSSDGTRWHARLPATADQRAPVELVEWDDRVE